MFSRFNAMPASDGQMDGRTRDMTDALATRRAVKWLNASLKADIMTISCGVI